MARLKKIYDNQLDALKASRNKSTKYSYEVKPTKKYFTGYQLIRRRK